MYKQIHHENQMERYPRILNDGTTKNRRIDIGSNIHSLTVEPKVQNQNQRINQQRHRYQRNHNTRLIYLEEGNPAV